MATITPPPAANVNPAASDNGALGAIGSWLVELPTKVWHLYWPLVADESTRKTTLIVSLVVAVALVFAIRHLMRQIPRLIIAAVTFASYLGFGWFGPDHVRTLIGHNRALETITIGTYVARGAIVVIVFAVMLRVTRKVRARVARSGKKSINPTGMQHQGRATVNRDEPLKFKPNQRALDDYDLKKVIEENDQAALDEANLEYLQLSKGQPNEILSNVIRYRKLVDLESYAKAENYLKAAKQCAHTEATKLYAQQDDTDDRTITQISDQLLRDNGYVSRADRLKSAKSTDNSSPAAKTRLDKTATGGTGLYRQHHRG